MKANDHIKTEIQSIITDLCERLADFPEFVSTHIVNGERNTIYEIKSHESDLGKLLGREGKNIKAIRQIAQSIASKNGFYAQVELLGLNVKS